jgi:hypothetical protein
LQPHRHTRPTAPLTAGARFIRGFTRIGAIAAVLVTLIGVAITIVQVSSSYDYELKRVTSAKCVAELVRVGYTLKKREYGDSLNFEVAGCSDSGIYGKSLKEVMVIANMPTPTFLTSDASSGLGIGLIITGVCAVVTYLAFWCIGWVFAGFTRDA